MVHTYEWFFLIFEAFICVYSQDQFPRFYLHVASSFNGWQLEVFNGSKILFDKLEVNKLCYNESSTDVSGYPNVSNTNAELVILNGDGETITNLSAIQNMSEDVGFLKCSRDGEGLAMTVLNQENGKITYYKILPMWEFWIHWDNLIRHLSYIPAGRIVIFAFSGQGSAGLRYAIPHLTELGSMLAQHLSTQSSWVWAFVKSGRTLHETGPLYGQPYLNASFPLFLASEKTASNNLKEPALRKFCDDNELMGNLCDFDSNVNDTLRPAIKIKLKNLENVPVVITAGSRLWYFSFTLRKLLTTPGVEKNNIVIVIGGHNQSFVNLAKLLGIKYETIDMVGENNARLFQYYRRVYEYVNATFPKSPAAIFLDEDTEVSPDFFNYFNQTLPLLAKDSTLYCVNAFSTARSSKLISDPTKVYRGTAQVAWGYSVTLDFVREALEVWPTNSSYDLYFDQYLMTHIADDRECVFPDQTRTLHFGSEGMNTKANFDFELYSQLLPIVRTYGIQISNVNDIPIKEFDKFLQRDIENATILEGNPCSDHFFPENTSGTFVLYYLFSGWPDKLHFNNFMISGLCLGFWSLSVQALHKGVTTFGVRNNSVLHMVAVPWSPYSYLTPMDEGVWDAFIYTNEERKTMLKYKDDWEAEERKKTMKQNKKKRREFAMKSLFKKSANDDLYELIS